MNTQHKNRVGVVDWDTRVKFVVKQPVEEKLPSIRDDVKNKRFKMQKRIGGKNVTKYFSYRKKDKEEARAEAEAFRF
jgi:hypothetical protein